MDSLSDRQHLREGACVLVDKEDQKTFQEVLDGTYVESPLSPPQPTLGPPGVQCVLSVIGGLSRKKWTRRKVDQV